MNALTFGLFLYLLLQLGIGIVVSRRIKNEQDYLVAGRRMGPLLCTATIAATWFGAETCVSSAGVAYEDGLSLLNAEPFGYGLCIAFMGLVFAVPLWRRKLVTLADLYRSRYSAGVERFAALLMIPTSVLWAAAQVRAFGQVVASTADVGATAGILIATGFVVAYTAFGGLLADAVTDLVQGIALAIGLVAFLYGVAIATGGFETSFELARAARSELATSEPIPLLRLLETWAVPVLGSVVAQELVARVSASRTEHVARGSALAAAGIYVALGMIPIFLGLVGTRLMPGLADPEQVLPELASRYLSPLFHALFTGALVSAILSTVDSTLLVSSSLFSHNLALAFLRAPTERTRLLLARGGVLGFGIIAAFLALTAESVYGLVEHASSLGSAGLVVILVFGLFTKVGGRASAYGALAAGLIVFLAAKAVAAPYPFLASFAAAFAGYVLPLARRTTEVAATE